MAPVWSDRVMKSGGTPTERLAGGVAAAAAHCSDFTIATVRLGQEGPPAAQYETGGAGGADGAGGDGPALIRVGAILDELVRRRGQPLAVGDLASGPPPDAAADPVWELAAGGSYVGVPLSRGGRVAGVLSVLHPEPRPIDAARLTRLLIELGRLLVEQVDQAVDPEVAAAADDLRAALDAHQIRPWYQPLVLLETGQTVGVEALARRYRDGGQVDGPASFLPAAERSGLVLDIDKAVMRHALADLAAWQQQRPDFRVSVNLSGHQLDDSGLPDQLERAAVAAGVRPATVDLEVTETVRPADLDVAGAVMADLTERGFTVWLDDFGSGWSTLQDLLRLPVGGIKLDRGFAERLGSPVADAIIAGVTGVADRIGSKVVLEGIEQRDQVERARVLGCHFGQGYLWGRPCPTEDVTAFLSG